MNDSTPRSQRTIRSYSAPDTVRLTLPLPKPGEMADADFPRLGLRVVVERMPHASQEELRARFVVTAPHGKDNRTHATRMGSGQMRPKKMGITVCTEDKAESLASGTRINGLPLESVTCPRCKSLLVDEGVQLAGTERSAE